MKEKGKDWSKEGEERDKAEEGKSEITQRWRLHIGGVLSSEMKEGKMRRNDKKVESCRDNWIF